MATNSYQRSASFISHVIFAYDLCMVYLNLYIDVRPVFEKYKDTVM